MSRLTRDGTAEPVSRDQILRHARGQGNIIFPVQLTTSRIGNLTRLIHTLLYVMTIHTYIHVQRECSAKPSTLCVESCVTKEFSISPRFSPTMFDPGANSVLLRAHLCIGVDSMRREPWVRNCSRKRKGLYSGNVQQNPLCAASCVTKDIPISPRFSPTFFYRRGSPAPYSVCVCVFSSHPFWTSSSLDVPAGVTQEEGHTGFLIHLPSAVRALIFVARRIQPFLSLVDREVEFCVLTN